MSITYGLHRSLAFNNDGLAVQFENRSHTWRQVANRVSRLASAFQAMGLQKGDRVAVLMLNQDRFLELYLATAWASLVIVPLNIRWVSNELQDALQDCRPKALVVDEAFADMGTGLAAGLAGVKLVYADEGVTPPRMLNYESLIDCHAPMADTHADGNELAGIFYTGGTTGRSKGVMLSHHNLLANGRNILCDQVAFRDSIYLHVAPMFHIAEVSAIMMQLLSGSRFAIERMFTPAGTAKAIEKFKATDTLLVPTMVQMFVDQPNFEAFDLSSLQRIVYGASPMNEAVLDRAIARLPHTAFLQAYGMTELSPCITILRWEDHLGQGHARARRRSAGRPTYFVDVKIVDAQDELVPHGTVGEICVRGETLMKGYWERPEETAKAIVNGWMHTGDAGYRDEDGFIYIVDRVKDMIVSGGENVYSAEVENCVAQHPAVALCAVIGIPHAQWGEAVHAVVMRKPGTTATAEEIIAFCKERMAGYKCPRSVTVQDDPLPISGAGKILKRELRKPYWASQSRNVS